MPILIRILGPLLCVLCIIAPAAAVTLDPAALPPSVAVGQTFRVGVTVSGLSGGEAPGLGSFDIDIGFDPSGLSLEGVIFGSGLDALGLGTLRTTIPGDGSVNVFELSLDAPDELIAYQSGQFELFAVEFRALSAGNFALTVHPNALADANGSALQVSAAGTTVSVTAVPEPATGMLVLAGLVVLIAARPRARTGRIACPR